MIVVAGFDSVEIDKGKKFSLLFESASIICDAIECICVWNKTADSYY
jgi:hypothetical protein